jgi:hypothetical protein
MIDRPERYTFRPIKDRLNRLTGLPHRFGLRTRVLHGRVPHSAVQLEQRAGLSHLHMRRHGAIKLTDGDGRLSLNGWSQRPLGVSLGESACWSAGSAIAALLSHSSAR